VEVDAFETTLTKTIHALTSMAPMALSMTKKSLNEIAAGLYNEPALKERARQSVFSQDFTEGRNAFAARRAPQFTGN
jgi:enoyl-CoA hydratase